jgi:hypothetical protein
MPVGIVPESFLTLLAAFAGCFGVPSYGNFELRRSTSRRLLSPRTVIPKNGLGSDAVGGRRVATDYRLPRLGLAR